jgi:16S rRNA (guanine527-N7)-methyltransferase
VLTLTLCVDLIMTFGKNDELLSDRRRGLRLVPVPRETEQRFSIYIKLLAQWRKKTDLISEATFLSVWSRHLADSAQILDVSPRAARWLDVGSGAGFPGMVLAMQLADVKDAMVHCVDSDQRKGAFLREAARATGAPAIIHSIPAQCLKPAELGIVDGITARAFAPLSQTLNMAEGWLRAGAVGVFPRGRSVTKQLASLTPWLNYEIEVVPSVVDGTAALLRVRLLRGPANGSRLEAGIL